jgi:hypothetical protein
MVLAQLRPCNKPDLTRIRFSSCLNLKRRARPQRRVPPGQGSLGPGCRELRRPVSAVGAAACAIDPGAHGRRPGGSPGPGFQAPAPRHTGSAASASALADRGARLAPAPAMPGRAGTCTGATKGGHCDDPTQPGHTAGVPVPVARARKPTQAPAMLIRFPDQGGAYGDSSWTKLRRAST